ncbi:hypothetical protein HUG10_09620 [Halorarum halophilum]|uniref:Uncharacterized protein n=1 Tax=Halorarum halophilum TaxID=2743090 RepID=A0A7D5H038_9EURY|nr:hypothetical protein [Halobaculum halophilum]QLG27793.1 hypothetical protein HUG10_09620 [Halobaculum halophilum]
MADDKRGRDKQAQDAERRQRERDIAAELERGDETEPPTDEAELDEFETELDSLTFPATGSEVVAAVGDREVESVEGAYTVEELVPDTDEERFDSPAAVRVRVQRPTIAAAMKRIVEASETLRNEELGGSQREAYEKTLRELKAIDADDEDEGIAATTDWIVERIRDKEKLPGSRAVRRQAAKFCRSNGYEVRNDDWLGV